MEQLLRSQNCSVAELGVNTVTATLRLVVKPPACLASDNLQGTFIYETEVCVRKGRHPSWFGG